MHLDFLRVRFQIELLKHRALRLKLQYPSFINFHPSALPYINVLTLIWMLKYGVAFHMNFKYIHHQL